MTPEPVSYLEFGVLAYLRWRRSLLGMCFSYELLVVLDVEMAAVLRTIEALLLLLLLLCPISVTEEECNCCFFSKLYLAKTAAAAS